MACLNPDGTPTASARAILQALETPQRPEDVAQQAGLPLFRVRSSLRELAAAGLVMERDGHYRRTQEVVSTR